MSDDDDDLTILPMRLPQVGEDVEEATISRWYVRPGEHVERDQAVVAISLDKADIELTAPMAGTIALASDEGETVAVGAPLARITPDEPRDAVRERQHRELLAAIAAAPSDVGLRDVYADFLLQAEGPVGPWDAEMTTKRAEYLALCARLRRPNADDDVAALRARRDALEDVAYATARSLVRTTVRATVTTVAHGFVAGVEGDVAALARALPGLLAEAPIERVRVLRVQAGDGARILELPGLERLHTLVLDGHLAADELAVVASSPRLADVHVDVSAIR